MDDPVGRRSPACPAGDRRPALGEESITHVSQRSPSFGQRGARRRLEHPEFFNLIFGLKLGDQEKSDLAAFLRSSEVPAGDPQRIDRMGAARRRMAPARRKCRRDLRLPIPASRDRRTERSYLSSDGWIVALSR